MKITIAQIEALKPCQNRLDVFKSSYKDFNGTIAQFLSLENTTYNDKVWVCTKLMTRNQKFQFALACAASVHSIFEAKYPQDKRVSDLIDYMSKIDDVEAMTEETRNRLLELRRAAAAAADAAYAAYAAYAAADADAAYAAADAAADADAAYAAYAAYAAADAAYAAAYAAADADADAAYAADAAAADADAAYAAAAADAADADAAYAVKETQQDLNLLFILEVMGDN